MPVLEWEVAQTGPSVVSHPAELGEHGLTWVRAEVPGTAASSLRALGEWDVDDRVDFDASDWWFRSRFTTAPAEGRLSFGGIATIAEVWLNDRRLLSSSNMFHRHDVVVELEESNEVVVVCRSLRTHLAQRRPRGRWKTRLVEMQQLRWARATLLGRMPSWTVPAAPVGLWRPVDLTIGDAVRVADIRLDAVLDDGLGIVTLDATMMSEVAPDHARIRIGSSSSPATIEADGHRRWRVHGAVTVTEPESWWPHTHGRANLHPVELDVSIGDDEHRFPIGPVGFRTVTVDQENGRFQLFVNGVAVFCRGACWTPLDVVRLSASADELRVALQLVVRAGMNMIRVAGTLVYEQDEFYRLCDEMGILVWQDLMFANMDYPIDDESFAASVTVEVEQFLARIGPRASVVVLCGGSEVEQQAAMMGVDLDQIGNRLGRCVLPQLVGALTTGIAYVPCSPSGGPFPFSPSSGVSHYYGVGAYERPLGDARRASVRFTSECLAFSNVPCRESVEDFLRDGERPGHAPRWKERVPRDRGAGWDFEDVRDFYVREIFGVDPSAVRYADPDRYLDLGRAAVCVAAESTLSEFRRSGSSCRGALIFLLRDLWAGAGWGIIDSEGRPKSIYHAVARTCAPLTVLLVDEGLNGLEGHLVNDTPGPFSGTVVVTLFGVSGAVIAESSQHVTIAPRATTTLTIDSVFTQFRDLNHAYRFGPLVYDVVSVELRDPNQKVVADAIFLPGGHQRGAVHDVGLSATADASEAGVEVTISTRLFAHFVSIDMPGFTPEHDWFHLAPGSQRVVFCSGDTADRPTMAGEVRALNVPGGQPIRPGAS